MVLSLSAWVGIEGAVLEPTWPAACFDLEYEPMCWYAPEFSPLWRPFVEFKRPPINQMLVGAHFCAVYLWLAAPLAVEIVNRTRVAAAAFVSTHLRLESWRL